MGNLHFFTGEPPNLNSASIDNVVKCTNELPCIRQPHIRRTVGEFWSDQSAGHSLSEHQYGFSDSILQVALVSKNYSYFLLKEPEGSGYGSLRWDSNIWNHLSVC